MLWASSSVPSPCAELSDAGGGDVGSAETDAIDGPTASPTMQAPTTVRYHAARVILRVMRELISTLLGRVPSTDKPQVILSAPPAAGNRQKSQVPRYLARQMSDRRANGRGPPSP